ncbi:MAG: hypothetical protein K6F52_01490 [Clostridia bacterium]|nr:hypothetical protein [Clostridia bacterium]
MKQFMVLMAVLPLLMVFILQMTYDQRVTAQISAVQEIVYSAKEDARLAGAFTPDIQARMRSEIAKALAIEESEVILECDSDIKKRDGFSENRMIRYKVKVPLHDVMAGGALLGVEEENEAGFVIDSFTASEKL